MADYYGHFPKSVKKKVKKNRKLLEKSPYRKLVEEEQENKRIRQNEIARKELQSKREQTLKNRSQAEQIAAMRNQMREIMNFYLPYGMDYLESEHIEKREENQSSLNLSYEVELLSSFPDYDVLHIKG